MLLGDRDQLLEKGIGFVLLREQSLQQSIGAFRNRLGGASTALVDKRGNALDRGGEAELARNRTGSSREQALESNKAASATIESSGDLWSQNEGETQGVRRLTG